MPHRAAQGIATDSYHLYLITSINEFGMRENIISIYSMDGKFESERTNASYAKDRDGRLMDFGDGFAINGSLYVTLYNWNSLPNTKVPLYSKIAVFDTKKLSTRAEFDIGSGTAEGITFHGESFWITFHDKPVIKQFSREFKPVKTFTLQIPSDVEVRDGYFEGMTWYGSDVFVNIHGPNVENSFYSPGLLRYHFNGSKFNYVNTIEPPTYGSGQGLDSSGNFFYFVDRPGNVIIRVNYNN